MRSELNLTEVNDFESDKGMTFISAVDVLIDELANQGINVKEMYENEIKKTASEVARAICAAVPAEPVF